VYEPLGDVESLTADVRIVAGTNRDLARLVEEGAFRRDLYYRVNVIRLVMPPLRERPSDIPLLAETILRRLSMNRGKIVDSITREAMRRIMDHDFPGNVRELENILEHAHVLSKGCAIEREDLPDWLREEAGDKSSDTPATFAEAEASVIRNALARNSWNRTATAHDLGIHKTTLHRKIRNLGIELPPVDGRSGDRRQPPPPRRRSTAGKS
jgi:DNA-binding NtrC family response regulator